MSRLMFNHCPKQGLMQQSQFGKYLPQNKACPTTPEQYGFRFPQCPKIDFPQPHSPKIIWVLFSYPCDLKMWFHFSHPNCPKHLTQIRGFLNLRPVPSHNTRAVSLTVVKYIHCLQKVLSDEEMVHF